MHPHLGTNCTFLDDGYTLACENTLNVDLAIPVAQSVWTIMIMVLTTKLKQKGKDDSCTNPKT